MITDNMCSYLKNFPFPTSRPVQENVLRQIEEAFNSGFKSIICECPTGSGKSVIGIWTAMTLGSSYILVSTKELQSQYARDFLFVRTCKGKNNFRCEVKDD